METILLASKHKDLLFQIPLFRDLPPKVRLMLFDKLDCTLYSVDKKDVIAQQCSLCKKLYVLLEGTLRVDIIDGNGNNALIEYIIAPRSFATPHLFSTDGILPATFIAIEKSILLTATKESMFKLISEEPNILKNFLCVSGNCNICTVSRLNVLSRKTVRERIYAYLREFKKANSPIVQIAHNQSELSEYLNVSRPALSKEINKMKKEGLIAIDGKQIKILNLGILQKI